MKTIVTAILLWASFACFGQKSLNTLQIGDKVPNVNLGEIVNHGFGIPAGKTGLFTDDLRGKLVILDFWAATCGVCIERFPKMTALQREFADKIVILAVGISSRRKSGNAVTDDLSPLIKKWKGTEKELKLPSTRIISPDSELLQLFKFAGVPTYAVIDTNGIFRLMTQSVLEKEDIQNMLNGKFEMYKKYSYKPKVHPKEGFLLEKLIQRNQTFDSAVAGYIDSLQYSMWIDSTNSNVIKLSVANQPLSKIYNYLYSEYYRVQIDERTINTTQFIRHKYLYDVFNPNVQHILKGPQLLEKYHYCYEAVCDKNSMSYKTFLRRVINDIDAKFSISSGVATSKIKVDNIEFKVNILELKESKL